MKVTAHHHSESHRVTYRFEDGPDVTVNWSGNKGKTMVAGRSWAEWTVPAGPNLVTVTGFIRRKDGSVGEVTGESRYYFNKPKYGAEAAPYWLRDLYGITPPF